MRENACTCERKCVLRALCESISVLCWNAMTMVFELSTSITEFNLRNYRIHRIRYPYQFQTHFRIQTMVLEFYGPILIPSHGIGVPKHMSKKFSSGEGESEN